MTALIAASIAAFELFAATAVWCAVRHGQLLRDIARDERSGGTVIPFRRRDGR